VGADADDLLDGQDVLADGLEIGYATAPERLQEALRAVHQFVTFATATPFQEAMADALGEARSNGYYDDLRDAYEARRALLSTALDDAGLKPLPVAGAYFLLTPIDTLPFASDAECYRWLIETVGVTPIPVSAFYADEASAPPMLRFCFAKEAATLREAGRRLAGLRQAMRTSRS
jgi:aspartate/methionine/tyrosine aminotransferase